ncbi:hypothetical protein LJR225_001991 [Phenylobacterium sp. LjRoot225]|uniref:hypothetical protein n=1 Tax=Phenylobacterium sp. LjRoot225 TaxID=3342285 RepID=UPI003ECE7400
MDAPTYPPAAAYEPPAAAPYELTVATASLAELMSAPAAWAIVLKHAPMYKMVVSAPHTKPYLTNFTVDSFVTYGVINQKTIDAIDADLRQLPRSQWPAL